MDIGEGRDARKNEQRKWVRGKADGRKKRDERMAGWVDSMTERQEEDVDSAGGARDGGLWAAPQSPELL